MGFIGFEIAITRALLQILQVLSRRKQEERKSRNQDFKAALAWIIKDLRPGALTGYKYWRAAVNSLCEKMSQILTGSGVVALQISDTS